MRRLIERVALVAGFGYHVDKMDTVEPGIDLRARIVDAANSAQFFSQTAEKILQFPDDEGETIEMDPAALEGVKLEKGEQLQ
jgi:hypothetical protein